MTVNIDVADNVHSQVSRTWAALRDGQDSRWPRVVARGNSLAQIVREGRNNDEVGLIEWEVNPLWTEVSRHCQFFAQTANGTADRHPPKDVVRALHQTPARLLEGVKVVDRVVTAPFVAEDKKGRRRIVTEEGYDEGSRTYLILPDSLKDLQVPDEVTLWQEVEEADHTLRKLFADFGFRDAASQANAYALMFLPFVRECVDNTPMHGIFASSPGTGKSTLATACLSPFVGQENLAVVTEGRDDEEWRKRITAFLREGSPAILIDNVSARFDSPALAAALTTGKWKDRILGKSETVNLDVRSAWVMTANNPELSDEQARRLVPIWLDAGRVRPSERPRTAFQHPDLYEWMAAHRRDLVEAALVIIRHWLDGPYVPAKEAGQSRDIVRKREVYGDEGWGPVLGNKTFGSYEKYARVMGGLLMALDPKILGPAFLSNRSAVAADSSEDVTELAEFLAAWHGHVGSEPLRFGQVLDLCQQINGPLREALPDALHGRTGDKLSAGMRPYLTKHKEQFAEGFILKNRRSPRPRVWWVERVD